MTTLLILAALGQFRYAESVKTPIVARHSAAVADAEPWPKQSMPPALPTRVVAHETTATTVLANPANQPIEITIPAYAGAVTKDDLSAIDARIATLATLLRETVHQPARAPARCVSCEGPCCDGDGTNPCPAGCPECFPPGVNPPDPMTASDARERPQPPATPPVTQAMPPASHDHDRSTVKPSVSPPPSGAAHRSAAGRAPRWATFDANPAYEVFGTEDAAGTFRYSATRLKAGYAVPRFAVPSCATGNCPRR